MKSNHMHQNIMCNLYIIHTISHKNTHWDTLGWALYSCIFNITIWSTFVTHYTLHRLKLVVHNTPANASFPRHATLRVHRSHTLRSQIEYLVRLVARRNQLRVRNVDVDDRRGPAFAVRGVEAVVLDDEDEVEDDPDDAQADLPRVAERSVQVVCEHNGRMDVDERRSRRTMDDYAVTLCSWHGNGV